MKKKKRDSAYWESRLRRDHPAIHAKLRAGEISSVRQAAIEAGLIRQPARADALKRHWKAASAAERKQFLEWLRDSAPGFPGRKARAAAPVADAEGRLVPPVVTFLRDWRTKHRTRTARIMKEMGLKPLNTTLADAINSGGRTRLRPDIIRGLESWLPANGYK